MDGTLLADLTPETLARVMLPKAAGAWNLHRYLENADWISSFCSPRSQRRAASQVWAAMRQESLSWIVWRAIASAKGFRL